MAIIIPSKNIYDKQNPKILKNVIKKIEINSKKISNKKEVNVPIECIAGDYVGSGYDEVVEDTDRQIDIVGNYSVSYIEVKTTYSPPRKYIIPILAINEYVSKVYTGKNDNGDNYIGVSYLAKKREGLVNGSFVAKLGNINNATLETVTEDFFFPVNYGEVQPFEFPKEETLTAGQTVQATSKVTIDDKSKLPTAVITKEGNNYVIELNGIFEMIITKVSATGQKTSASTNDFYFSGNGTREYILTTKAEFSLMGVKIGIDLQDEVVKISTENLENTKNSFSIDGNELIQTSNYYDDTVNEVENSLIKNYNTTLAEYQNGKETAEILCSISNYYDESGKGKISTDEATLPMTFNIGDEVVPMVMNSLGKDTPMSKSKTFEVVGVDFIYDGAVWQKLTLLQK